MTRFSFRSGAFFALTAARMTRRRSFSSKSVKFSSLNALGMALVYQKAPELRNSIKRSSGSWFMTLETSFGSVCLSSWAGSGWDES